VVFALINDQPSSTPRRALLSELLGGSGSPPIWLVMYARLARRRMLPKLAMIDP
jgi:hypothetical protein